MAGIGDLAMQVAALADALRLAHLRAVAADVAIVVLGRGEAVELTDARLDAVIAARLAQIAGADGARDPARIEAFHHDRAAIRAMARDLLRLAMSLEG